jgi:hypothetical protein
MLPMLFFLIVLTELEKKKIVLLEAGLNIEKNVYSDISNDEEYNNDNIH